VLCAWYVPGLVWVDRDAVFVPSGLGPADCICGAEPTWHFDTVYYVCSFMVDLLTPAVAYTIQRPVLGRLFN
jgi:hypothetical protein